MCHIRQLAHTQSMEKQPYRQQPKYSTLLRARDYKSIFHEILFIRNMPQHCQNF